MSSAEQYLKPEVIQSIARLDLAQSLLSKGCWQDCMPVRFTDSVSNSANIDDTNRATIPKDIDWQVFARTDRFYIKRYQAETNITGYLLMDLSRSMGYTYRQTLTKFDYAICLAASISYLMIHQQDPVGLMTFDDELRASLPARSRRSHLGDILAVLQRCKPTGTTNIGGNLRRVASMIRHRSLMMLMSDLLADPDEIIDALRMLRYRGHDVILFHILDEAEVTFPFSGSVDLLEPESQDHEIVDAAGIRADYLEAVAESAGTISFRMFEYRSGLRAARYEYAVR